MQTRESVVLSFIDQAAMLPESVNHHFYKREDSPNQIWLLLFTEQLLCKQVQIGLPDVKIMSAAFIDMPDMRHFLSFQAFMEVVRYEVHCSVSVAAANP